MFNIQNIEKIAKVEGENLLSLYLDVDRKKYSSVLIQTKLKNLFKDVNLPEPEKLVIEQKVSDLFNRSAHSTKSLVVFRSKDSWFEYVFSQEIEDAVFVDKFFNISPLMTLLRKARTVGVLLFDSEQARFLCVFLGHLEAHQHIEDRMIRRQKRGGWSKPRFERKVNGEVKEHLKNTIDFLTKMDKIYQLDLIYVRSESELEDEFNKLLPKNLEGRIKGWIKLQMDARPDEIVEIVDTLTEEEVEKEAGKELSTVEDIIKNDINNDSVVFGFDSVSKAFYDQKVSKILVNNHYEEAGFYCHFCGFVSISSEFCPYDQGPNNRTTNVISVLLDEAVKRKVQVEVFENDPTLKKYDNIVALLNDRRSII